MNAASLPFVHLRCRSAYSLLEGAVEIKGLRDLALRHEMPALAITDINNLFGALEFSETLASAGVQPIVGVTLALGRPAKQQNANTSEIAGTIALLAASREGYLNLMALSSKAFLDVEPTELPHVNWPDICAHSAGLIALSGGFDGVANQYLHDGQVECAQQHLSAMAETFGDAFFVEIQRHGRPEETQSEPALMDWADRHGIPMVATNEPYFAEQKMHAAHDALLCISQSTYLSVPDRLRLTQEHYFKSGKEMAERFSDMPELIQNTAHVAMQCHYRPRTHKPILPNFTDGKGMDEAEALAIQARKGLQERLDHIELAEPEEAYWKRLEHELKIINEMGFPGYFLIVADFIKWANSQGIPVGPGRGSGAGSVVAWALTITGLDPLRFGLLFERFLNPERVSMPDFDIDFCQERRGEVIDYVREKYGKDKVAQIITFGTLQARVVLRDVGRVMQLPLGLVDRLAKMVPSNPANPVSLKEAIATEPGLQQARDEDQDVAQLLSTALELEGLYRNTSTHAAGVVIGDRPLVQLAPLYRDPRSDVPATQFNMKWAENSGLVKFDFLGLKTLTVIDRAVSFLKQRNVDINIDALPLDDVQTYALLSRADTVGIFQLESAGMRDVLRKARPDCFEDIIAIVALYRPGPMENIPKYAACKHGQEKPLFLHDKITHITAETYGVIIYQEQVMQIAQVLAGFSLGDADLLRRAMGKKIKSEMQAQRARFVDGAMKNGVEESKAEYIFDLVDKFAGYGFNKSHSAAYALVSYQTAWLKAHHPVELLAALMSLDITNTDKLAGFILDARQQKVEVCGPDINRSEADFTVKDNAILYALGAVRNVGTTAMEHVVEERRKNGPFSDLYDFARRVDPKVLNKRALENLARAGAFDSLEPNRHKAFKAASHLMAHAALAEKERQSAQVGLFGDEAADIGQPALPDQKDWDTETRLQKELAAMGFYFSGHPIDSFAEQIVALGVSAIGRMPMQIARGGSAFRLAAVVRAKRERTNQRGKRFAFITFSDPSGECEALASPEILESASAHLATGTPVMASIKVDKGGGGDSRLRLVAVEPLQAVVAIHAGDLRVTLASSKQALSVKDCLEALKGRQDIPLRKLHLVFNVENGSEVEVLADGLWPADPAARKAVKSLAGVMDAQEIPLQK
jgi:DNA polymerase III subunit alpha